ncbi:hypothetical protein [Rhodovulum imhoffii]|nr:hypothetical protein [Rhodovulum imhoffii]
MEDLRRARTRREVAEFQAERIAVALSGTPETVQDIASRAGAHALWRDDMAARRANLNGEIARCRVAEEQVKKAALRAFGRQAALRNLLDKVR